MVYLTFWASRVHVKRISIIFDKVSTSNIIYQLVQDKYIWLYMQTLITIVNTVPLGHLKKCFCNSHIYIVHYTANTHTGLWACVSHKFKRSLFSAHTKTWTERVIVQEFYQRWQSLSISVYLSLLILSKQECFITSGASLFRSRKHPRVPHFQLTKPIFKKRSNNWLVRRHWVCHLQGGAVFC